MTRKQVASTREQNYSNANGNGKLCRGEWAALQATASYVCRFQMFRASLRVIRRRSLLAQWNHTITETTTKIYRDRRSVPWPLPPWPLPLPQPRYETFRSTSACPRMHNFYLHMCLFTMHKRTWDWNVRAKWNMVQVALEKDWDAQCSDVYAPWVIAESEGRDRAGYIVLFLACHWIPVYMREACQWCMDIW